MGKPSVTPLERMVAVAFSPDGQTLAAGGVIESHVGAVTVWRTGRGRPTR